MKAVVAIAVGSLLVFSGCGQMQPEKLPGSWELTRQEAFFKSKTGESRSDKNISHEDSYLYVFDQGKMYVPGKNSQAIYQASYQLDGDKLVLQGSDQAQHQFKINELSDDKLKLEKKTVQGESEERVVLSFTRVGGYNNSGVVNNRGNENGNVIPRQPYNAAPNTRMPAPTATGNIVPPRA